MIRKPSDLGYEDDGFALPPCNIDQITVHSEEPTEGFLFAIEASDLGERQKARRSTVSTRASACAELVNNSKDAWVVWCDLNDESSELARLITDSVEVRGSDSNEHKESAMMGFADGKHRVIVTKPKIAGFGMNWQICHNVAFVGLSDSYEMYYQAVRRCWRFGQTKPVNVKVITSDLEGAVVRNIERKEADAMRMAQEMVQHMHLINEDNIKGMARTVNEYKTDTETGTGWTLHLGDSCEVIKSIADNSIGFSVFSPPFASLYTYSNSDRDMGNSKEYGEFADHFGFLARDLFRVTMPGRLLSFHVMNLPTSKTHDGYIGIRDFRGDMIRLFESVGFIFHSEVCIWKDPVTAMQRTKALGLLHKQIVKDSAMSRQGIPDYLVTMRKPGENKKPIEGEFDHWAGESFQSNGRYSIDVWQRYASPVWMDIDPSNTLQYRAAREENDERHICPLQLDVIHRALQMWSNPGDLILSPFAGIGSEGYESVKMGRQFVGIELKESYWKQAVKNMKAAETEAKKYTLFNEVEGL
jgi:hypothetical protein